MAFTASCVSPRETICHPPPAILADFTGYAICVNCAGIGPAARTFGKKGVFPLDKFNQVIAVNLVGTFNVLRLAAEQMAGSAIDDTHMVQRVPGCV